MWSLACSCHPFVVKDGIYERHPKFPSFDVAVPTKYSQLGTACMSRDPNKRPTFVQIVQVLASLELELPKKDQDSSRGAKVCSLLLHPDH